MPGNTFLLGAGVGMALAFLFDPGSGRRRRALVGDQLKRTNRKTRDAVEVTARDMANRTKGLVAAARGRLRGDGIDDETLVARVRAKLGRACSHPRAIDVQALQGHVTLRGPVLASEVAALLAGVRAVRGVRSVSNELESHDSAEGIPALQGQGSVAEPALDVLQQNWAPGTQALVTAAGAALAGFLLVAFARRAT